MTSSPDLHAQLRAARPSAPRELRARVRELATAQAAPAPVFRLRLPSRRAALVVLPAAAAIALASAGVVGLSRSDVAPRSTAVPELVQEAPNAPAAGVAGSGAAPQDSAAPAPLRAQQVSATLTLEVRNSAAVSNAAQDALELTRSLGGYVVSSSVATGDEGNASLVVRVPVGKVQDAIVGLSALGRIVSQQVNVQDLQESLDTLGKREATVRTQIARVRARLESESLDPQTEAVLRSRLQTLRGELVQLRSQIAATNAEARMSTIQLTVVTPGATGVAPPTSRIDRTIDEALNVLAWEGVVAFGLLIALAPFAIAGLVVWLGRRAYRRREEERLLAAS